MQDKEGKDDNSVGDKFQFVFFKKTKKDEAKQKNKKRKAVDSSFILSKASVVPLKDESTENLWKIYHEDKKRKDWKCSSAREELILRHINYAANLHGFFIRRYISGLKNTIVSDGDLRGASLLGLIQAVDRFKVDVSVKFETFAFYRIIGAMFDCVREYQHVPRSVAKDRRELGKKIELLSHDLGRHATSDDIINFLNEDSSRRILRRNFNLMVLNNRKVKDETIIYTSEIEGSIDCAEIESEVMGTLSKCENNEKMNYSTIIYSYYYLGLNIQMIALILGCSQSLVTKRKNEAIEILRSNISREIFYYG